MATIALWMMIIGGLVGVIGLWTVFQSADGMNRGDLAKPLTIVGVALFF